MELNHLRHFHEVALAGSFTAAARRLRISQPALSKTVRMLEEYEGVRLFDRGKKGVRLTKEGQLFLQTTRAVFDEIEALRRRVHNERERCTGTLVIGASDNLCNYVLPGVLHAFWKDNPAVSIDLLSGTAELIQHELVSGRLEMGCFYNEPSLNGLQSERIATVEFALVCSASNRMLARMKQFDRKRLSEAYFIGSRRGDYQSPYRALRLLQDLGVEPRLFFETNNQETQKRMVLEGKVGYTMIPRFMIERELASGRLCRLPAPRPLVSDLFLVMLKGHSLSRTGSVFRDHLGKSLARLG